MSDTNSFSATRARKKCGDFAETTAFERYGVKTILCLYYGFRDAILFRLVTIIKRLVHHAVYCISLSCLLSFLCNPYIPFLIYGIF